MKCVSEISVHTYIQMNVIKEESLVIADIYHVTLQEVSVSLPMNCEAINCIWHSSALRS